MTPVRSCLLIVVLLAAPSSASAQALLPERARPFPGLTVEAADGTVDVGAVETLLNAQLAGEDEPRFAQAARLFEGAPNVPRPARYYEAWLRVYLALGDIQKGSALLARAVGEHPRDIALQGLRVSYAVRTRCKECADAAVATLREIAPDDPVALRTFGHYDLAFFNGVMAVEHLEKAARGPGVRAWNYVLLGQAYDRRNRGDDALAAWAMAAKLAPLSAYVASENAVVLAHYGKDPEIAAREAQRALALADGQPRALHALAYADWGRWAAAFGRDPGAASTQRLYDVALSREGDVVGVFKHACTYSGSAPIAVALLRAKRVPATVVSEQDERGFTCIGNVIDNGDSELARVLIGLGADIDSPDGTGRTLLMRAVEKKDRKTFDLLLELGADVNAVGARGSALSYVAYDMTRSIDMAKRLLDAKADPNAESVEEETPLHGAALRLDVELAQLLLERGANVDAEAIGGHRPLGWALSTEAPGIDASKRAAMVELLMRHGADPVRGQGLTVSPLDYAKEFRPDLVGLLERR